MGTFEKESFEQTDVIKEAEARKLANLRHKIASLEDGIKWASKGLLPSAVIEKIQDMKKELEELKKQEAELIEEQQKRG
jgi:hypothetical protein